MDSLTALMANTQVKSLHTDTPTPLYFRLYSLLKAAILDGSIGNGAQMPTEQQLAEGFNVSRITAKRAMDELAAEGLVMRRRGKGTHVTYEYTPKPVAAPLVGMLQEIESMARHSDARVLSLKKGTPPPAVREVLQLDDKDKALHLVRVRSRDGKPFAYYDSWTKGLAGKLSKTDFREHTRLELFRRAGLAISHVTQTISAVAASAELASHLQTDPGSPLLSLTRYSYDAQQGEEVLVDYLQAYYHPDRFQYQMDLKLDDMG